MKDSCTYRRVATQREISACANWTNPRTNLGNIAVILRIAAGLPAAHCGGDATKQVL